MILCDTGPLVALIDRGDPHHPTCTTTLRNLPATSFLTTWPCVTEAMHLLRRAGGYAAQSGLRSYFETGLIVLHEAEKGEWGRTLTLMHQYRDTPMDFADASLVAAAEVLNVFRIFTLDKHFHAYRIFDTKPFEVVP